MNITAMEADAVHRYWKVHEGFLTRMAETSFINEGVVSLEHDEMEVRHQHVRIIAPVTDKHDAFYIALEVCFIQTKQELR